MRNKCHNQRIKTLFKVSLFILLALSIWGVELYKAQAINGTCIMEIEFQGIDKNGVDQGTDSAVPQGMAGNGNTLYLIKNRKQSTGADGKPARTYILKVLNANTSSPKLILPENGIKADHANGMTYYNGYLYIAAGDGFSPAIYRVKEANSCTTGSSPSIRWLTNTDNTIHYDKEKLTVSGINSGEEIGEEIRNIAHYSGDYFIVCLKKNGDGPNYTMTYGVGIVSGSTFTIQKRFIVNLKNTYTAVQDIDYKDGYLWILLYESGGTNNNIHLVEIPKSYNAIENGKTYNVNKTVTISKDEAGHVGTRNEMESVYVNGSYFYTWSNIRDTDNSWNETLCRYPRIPNGVDITSITTKSKVTLVINWNPVDYADKYIIKRRSVGGAYSEIATVSSSTTSYSDTGLTAGTKYFYRVFAVNSNEESPEKSEVFGVTRTVTPKVSSVEAVSESELRVTWNAVTGANKYIICRKKEGDGEGWQYYSRVKETTGTEYLDSGLEPNTTYHYGIIAVTETGVESGSPSDNANPGSENRLSGKTLEAIQVTLNKSILNCVVGESDTLVATITPEYAENSQVSWSSSDSSVVSIDQTGKLTALNPGTAVITATEQMKNKIATCTVNVLASDALQLEEEKTILNGTYRIRLSGTTQVLSIENHSDEDGANVGLEQETDSNEYSLFRFTYAGNGYYTVSSIGSGKYLEDTGTDTGIGKNVQQNSASNVPEQMWQPVERNGLYYLTPQSNPNLVMNMGDIDNTLIQSANLWIPKNSALQLFELVPVHLEMNEADFVLPEGITEIEESAFEGIGAHFIYIPDNCTRIGAYAFRNSNVDQIRIPNGCVLEDGIFDGCDSVMIFGATGSAAQTYCEGNDNCTFFEE